MGMVGAMAPMAAHAADCQCGCAQVLNTSMLIADAGSVTPTWFWQASALVTMALNIASIEISESIWPVDHSHGHGEK